MRLSLTACLPAIILALAGCASPQPATLPLRPTDRDLLYTPESVTPGRLEYAPDRSRFPPVLTERFPYPTQTEANNAYLRSISSAPANPGAPLAIWLFGCKPGGIDAWTGRVKRFRRPVVHCATDFLDGSGHAIWRETANFEHNGALWLMQPVSLPRAPVPWLTREDSPKDLWWFIPGRGRYQ